MAWIESHQSLSRHRKTMRAAKLLRCDRVKLLGHLHELWWWAIDNASIDGRLGDISAEELAEAACWPRGGQAFTAALIDAGFVDQDGPELILHDWYEYAGKLNDQRELRRQSNRERQQRRRDKLRDSGAAVSDVGVTVTRDSRVTQRDSHQSTNPTNLTNLLASKEASLVRTHEDDGQDDLPLDAREIRDLVLSKLPTRYQRDPLTWEEAEQLGQDYAGQHTAVCVAIEECRRTPEKAGGGLPFPQRLRRFLAPPAATVQRFEERGLFSPTGEYVGRPVWEDEAVAEQVPS